MRCSWRLWAHPEPLTSSTQPVRAGALTDGERTGRYRHGFPPTERSLEFEISRADAAAFTLGLLADGTYLRESPSLSYRADQPGGGSRALPATR